MGAALFLVLVGCGRTDNDRATSRPAAPETAREAEGPAEYVFSVDQDLLEEPTALPTGIVIQPPVGWQQFERDTEVFRQFEPSETNGFRLELVAVSDAGAALTAGYYEGEIPPQDLTRGVTDDPENLDVFRSNGIVFHQARLVTEQALVFLLATDGSGTSPSGTSVIQFTIAAGAVNEPLMRQVESAIGSIRRHE